MSTKFGAALAANVTGKLPVLVACANFCAAAYNKNAGYPAENLGVDKPEAVAQNLAGLQAVISGVSALALLRGIKPYEFDAAAAEILGDIANDDLTEIERGIVARFANATWGAGQAFRTDKGPLGRATRVNFFDDLPLEEVEKDYVQIRAAANFLLGKLAATEVTA